MNYLLLSGWDETNTALVIGVGALIAAIVAFVIAILKNESLRASIVGRLISRVRGGQVVSKEDLDNHELKLKLLTYSVNKIFAHFKDPARLVLYRMYVSIFTGIFLESIENILKSDYINLSEFQLKALIINQVDWRNKQYAERFKKVLMERHNNVDEIDVVLRKLEEWSITESEMITENVIAVIGYGRFNSILNKLDIIFNLYALGIDILIKKSAESFERLNGELDNFLKITR